MENFTFLLQTLMAYALTDTGLLIVGVSCLTVALIGLAFVSRVSSRSADAASRAAAPANTRRQDLERYMNGEITIDQYLDLQSGRPEDGSRKVEAARIKAPTHKLEIRESNGDLYTQFECSPTAHPGKRVASTRVRCHPVTGAMQVFQPRSGTWMFPRTWDIRGHTCCPRYTWILEINGKRFD